MTNKHHAYGRNVALSLVAVVAAVVCALTNHEPVAIALVTFIAGLWMHSGRDRAPLLVVLSLAAACTGAPPSGQSLEIGMRFAPRSLVGDVAALSPPFRATGLQTDLLTFTPQAAPTCASGKGCIYSLNTNGLFYTVDANNLTLKLHAAQQFQTSSNCSGLSSPANGDVCYDTTIPAFRFYSAGWTTAPTNDSLLLHKAGSETITGVKTFSAAPVFATGVTASGAVAFDLSGSTGNFLFPTGNATWAGAAGKQITLTQGVATTASPYALKVIGGAHTTLTASTEANDIYTDLSRTVQFATGAITTQRAFLIDNPTYAFVGASTITNAATLAIAAAPAAGTNATITNAHALWVQAGNSQFDGGITLATTATLKAGSNTLIGSVADKLNAAMLAIASQATGDLLVADSASTFARKAIGTDNQVLSVVSGAVAWSTRPMTVVSGGGTGALGAATVYLTAPGQAASATEIYLGLATRATTSRNLYCFVGTAPGGADTVVVTVRESAADQALTCTITGAGTTCNDTSNSFASVAGDRLSVKAVSSAGTAANITCSFEQT